VKAGQGLTACLSQSAMEIVVISEELCECSHLIVEHEELEGPCKAGGCECEAMEPLEVSANGAAADMAP